MSADAERSERRVRGGPARRRRRRARAGRRRRAQPAPNPSQIPWYRGKGLSSVDDLDSLAGQAALDYALAGDSGSFGVKSTADSLLPSVATGSSPP